MKKSKLFFVAFLAITSSLHAVSREGSQNKSTYAPSKEFLNEKVLCEEAIKNNDAETIRRIFCTTKERHIIWIILKEAKEHLDSTSINKVFIKDFKKNDPYVKNNIVFQAKDLLDPKSVNHVLETTRNIGTIKSLLQFLREWLNPVSVRQLFEKAFLEEKDDISELILKKAKDLLGTQFVGQIFETTEDSNLRVSILEHAKEWLDPAFVKNLFDTIEDSYLRVSILEHAKEWLDPASVKNLFDTIEDSDLQGSILEHAKEWLDPASVGQLFEKTKDEDTQCFIVQYANEWLKSESVNKVFKNTNNRKLKNTIAINAKDLLDPEEVTVKRSSVFEESKE